MTNRMTGISGLIDTDALVEASLLRQKTKINTATQNLKIQQYKQEQYRTIMTQAKSFYNNYFDILSGNSLAATKAYNIMSAKSSDSNSVTATASTKAKAANYEVSVTNKATSAKYQLTGNQFKDINSITINNVNVDLSEQGTGIKITGNETSDELKAKLKLKADYLNTKLKNAGVTATYSDFVNNGTGGLVVETNATGKDAELSVFASAEAGISPLISVGVVPGTYTKTSTNVVNLLDKIETYDESNPKDVNNSDIKNIIVSGIDLTLSDEDLVKLGKLKKAYSDDNSDENKKKLAEGISDAINNAINTKSQKQPDGQKLSEKVKAFYSDDGNVGFESKIVGSNVSLGVCNIGDGTALTETPGISAHTESGISFDQNNANSIISKVLSGDKSIVINGHTVQFSGGTLTDFMNAVQGFGIQYNSSDGTFSSSDSATAGNFTLSIRNNDGMIESIDEIKYSTSFTDEEYNAILQDPSKLKIDGRQIDINSAAGSTAAERLKNALAEKGITYDETNKTLTSTSSFTCTVGTTNKSITETQNDVSNVLNKVISGKDAKVKITNKDTGLSYDYYGAANQITLDEVTFNIKDAPSDGSKITINVKPDGSELKDKIVDFINDYNSLLGAINSKLYEEYDRSYKPLTDDDKEGLTDGQIEKLEKKAQTGLLRNDSYLTNFADQMKEAMSSIMKNSGLSLERIGITPKQDYTTENGLFEIDEDKLLSAIEKDPDGIKDLFLKGIANNSVSDDDGIMSKMTDIMKKQVVNFDSIFARRAGFSTGTYATINEMTLDIKDRQKKISELQDAYDTKEDLLYKKYASLESSLASLQSQQSSLSSYFG